MQGEIIEREFTLKIHYLLPERDENGKIVSSGIRSPTQHIEDELRLDISRDLVFDWEADRFVDSEKYQINLKGSQEALYELGTLLIAIAHYEQDPDYHIHLDDIKDSSGQVIGHLIIHVPAAEA